LSAIVPSTIPSSTIVADSAEATGLKWATPSAGGGANWSLLNSGGTALTGATTITVSGISAKDKIFAFVTGGSTASGSAFIQLRFNADSGANYAYTQSKYINQSAYSTGNTDLTNNTTETYFPIARMGTSAAGTFGIGVTLTGCNAAGVKVFDGWGVADGTDSQTNMTSGVWNNSATVTSISILSSSGNFDGSGRIYVYTSA
jgi:hypothetical protein